MGQQVARWLEDKSGGWPGFDPLDSSNKESWQLQVVLSVLHDAMAHVATHMYIHTVDKLKCNKKFKDIWQWFVTFLFSLESWNIKLLL